MSGQLKEVRTRIKSVRNTQKITSAMKMVAAAKLRKAQQAIVQMRPYSKKLNSMLQNIVSNLDGDVSVSYGKEREIKNAAVVVVTSDRGLCGAFNSNVIKEARKVIEGKYSAIRENKGLTIVCIGKRGYDYFRKNFSDCNINSDYVNYIAKPTFVNAAEVAEYLMKSFDTEELDSIHVAFGRFRNPAVQYPECDQYLPVPKVEKAEGEKSKYSADFIFEPDRESLLNELFPSILKTQIFRYMLETAASEQGARMTAMANATDNAEELVRELKVMYNKARQEAITREISEIVGGAAALEG